jgi:hypothetical protein
MRDSLPPRVSALPTARPPYPSARSSFFPLSFARRHAAHPALLLPPPPPGCVPARRRLQSSEWRAILGGGGGVDARIVRAVHHSSIPPARIRVSLSRSDFLALQELGEVTALHMPLSAISPHLPASFRRCESDLFPLAIFHVVFAAGGFAD